MKNVLLNMKKTLAAATLAALGLTATSASAGGDCYGCGYGNNYNPTLTTVIASLGGGTAGTFDAAAAILPNSQGTSKSWGDNDGGTYFDVNIFGAGNGCQPNVPCGPNGFDFAGNAWVVSKAGSNAVSYGPSSAVAGNANTGVVALLQGSGGVYKVGIPTTD